MCSILWSMITSADNKKQNKTKQNWKKNKEEIGGKKSQNKWTLEKYNGKSPTVLHKMKRYVNVFLIISFSSVHLNPNNA